MSSPTFKNGRAEPFKGNLNINVTVSDDIIKEIFVVIF